MSPNNTIKDDYAFQLAFLHPRHWLTWLGLAVFFVITFLPMPVIDWLGCRLGRFVAQSNKKRFNITSTNLSLCFPEKTDEEIVAMANKNFQAQFRSLMHYGVLWWRPVWLVKKSINKTGFELIEQYKNQGKNIIILLPHYVGLEFFLAAIAMDESVVGLYKAMKNPVINWIVANGRLRFGRASDGMVISREQGLRPLIRETRAGKTLVYLADEDLGAQQSVFVPFYGVPKATIPVLGRLAKSCKAVVLPCVCCYRAETRQYEIKLLPAIEGMPTGDDEADILSMNKALERAIDHCPVEYLWSLRYFKTRPPGEASVYD